MLGIAIGIFALWHLYAPKAWEEWTNLVLGVWLIISPWALGFAFNATATINMVMVGIIVFAFAAYMAMQESQQGMHLKQRR